MISHFQWKPLFKKKGFPAGKYRFIIKGFTMKESIINQGKSSGAAPIPRTMTSLP